MEGGLYRENGEELPGIMINKTLALMTPIYRGFLIFKEENKKKSPNPRDFLRSVIIHEYGHIFDDMKTDYTDMITTGLIRNLAESEAFAFWFADELTGLKTLYEETINSYLDPVNANKMRYLHYRLHETSAERGIDYVLRNHRMLMCKYSMNLDQPSSSSSSFSIAEPNSLPNPLAFSSSS
jgi:hypothetical protein